MKISIIVPIYNVQKQLKKCIDSLLKQEDEKLNVQIILVNDGATDDSGKIAKTYYKKYNDKIIYLEKENGGLSDARNYGLKFIDSDSNYIAFVDSDDYISDKMYLKLLPYMEKEYDMVKIKVSKVKEDGEIIEDNYSPEFEDKTGEEAFEILYKTDVMTEVAWGYIYRKDFFMENNFKFAKGLYHEDFGLIPLIMLKAKKVASSNVGKYFYVQTEKSITRGDDSKKLQRAQDLLKHYDNMIKEVENFDISEKSKENIKIYYTNCIILEVANLQGQAQKDYIKEIKKRKMTKNIKARNIKQFIKKVILNISIKLYLKLR